MSHPHSVVFVNLQGFVCVVMGVIMTVMTENLDVITGVRHVNCGRSQAHFSAFFFLYFNVGSGVLIYEFINFSFTF